MHVNCVMFISGFFLLLLFTHSLRIRFFSPVDALLWHPSYSVLAYTHTQSTSKRKVQHTQAHTITFRTREYTRSTIFIKDIHSLNKLTISLFCCVNMWIRSVSIHAYTIIIFSIYIYTYACCMSLCFGCLFRMYYKKKYCKCYLNLVWFTVRYSLMCRCCRYAVLYCSALCCVVLWGIDCWFFQHNIWILFMCISYILLFSMW